MTMKTLDWEQIGSCARQFRIRRILTLNLLLANRLLAVNIPPAAQHVVEGGTESLVEMIEGFISGGAPFDVESLDYFRCMMRLREKPIDRVRFAARLLFTPGPGEWASVRLPDFLFPAYRLVRLSRLSARLARL